MLKYWQAYSSHTLTRINTTFINHVEYRLYYNNCISRYNKFFMDYDYNYLYSK